jgi:hypothetical protein
MSEREQVTVGRIVRTLFGTATATLLVAAFALGGNPRVFAAAAACGTVWWAWDVLAVHVFAPVGEWITDVIVGGGVGASDASTRPSLDEVVEMLERHLERPTSRQLDINAAIRLEEIYRTVKQDPAASRRVVEVVRSRYPDAPELARFASRPTSAARTSPCCACRLQSPTVAPSTLDDGSGTPVHRRID